MHLAALIYRGMLYKLKEHFYYTKHKLFETPGFRRIISQNKMQNFYILLIMRSSLFLTTKSPKFSQYWKNSWYVSNYYVSWRAIYPLMSPFSCGRNALVENNTFKEFVLSEGSTGYVWNVIWYARGDPMLSENIDSDYRATKVLITLMEDKLHKRHCVYIDNWYTSIEICNVLNNWWLW